MYYSSRDLINIYIYKLCYIVSIKIKKVMNTLCNPSISDATNIERQIQ